MALARQRLIVVRTELASHPDVLEVAVVARAHPRWGERPMAFVILHPQRASKWKGKHDAFEEELKKHARTRLPGFACPEWVSVVEDLPVSVDLALRSTCFGDTVVDRKPRRARYRRWLCERRWQSCEHFCVDMFTQTISCFGLVV